MVATNVPEVDSEVPVVTLTTVQVRTKLLHVHVPLVDMQLYKYRNF